jgi:hypothetical protein
MNDVAMRGDMGYSHLGVGSQFPRVIVIPKPPSIPFSGMVGHVSFGIFILYMSTPGSAKIRNPLLSIVSPLRGELNKKKTAVIRNKGTIIKNFHFVILKKFFVVI